MEGLKTFKILPWLDDVSETPNVMQNELPNMVDTNLLLYSMDGLVQKSAHSNNIIRQITLILIPIPVL